VGLDTGVQNHPSLSLSLSHTPSSVGDAESAAGGNFSTRPTTDVCLRSEAPAEAARELFASGVRISF